MRLHSKVLGIICLLAIICATGCMKPPVLWRHDPGQRRWPPSGQSLLVEPVEDLRVPHNEKPSLLRWIPLVPYTHQTQQMFERELAQDGTRRGSKGRADLIFAAASDLHWAIHDQLSRGRLFGPVFISADQIGPWEGQPAPDPYRLVPRLERLTLIHRHLRYGLGPAAPLAYALGAPRRRVEVVLDLDLKLLDSDGEMLQTETIEDRRLFYDGWYQQLESEQRVLDWVSLRLGETLDRLQEQAAEDLK